MSLFLSALGLGFAVAAPIGPTGITAIRQGLASGPWTAFWIGMGAALTDLVYILLTYAGVTPLIRYLPWLPVALYAAGAFVLGRMGVLAIRDALRAPGVGARTDGATTPAAPSGWRGPLWLGIAITVVNPSTITAWLSIGGAFIAANLRGLPLLQSLAIMAGVMVGSAAWFSILAAIVGLARASLARLPWLFRAVEAGSGGVLITFAVVFAWKLIQLM